MDHRKITAVLIAVIFIFTVIPVSAAGGSRSGYDVSRTKPAADGTYYETVIKTKGNPSGDAFSRKARNKTATSSKTMYHKTKYGKVLWYVKVTRYIHIRQRLLQVRALLCQGGLKVKGLEDSEQVIRQVQQQSDSESHRQERKG